MSYRDWRPTGRVYLWRYRDSRSFRGWHLTADKAGGESLLALFSAFAAEEISASRIMPLSDPTPAILQVPNFHGGLAEWYAPSNWRISFHPAASDAELWLFPPDKGAARLDLGSDCLKILASHVADLMTGGGDDSMGGEAKESAAECSDLWFWWQPRQAR